MKLNPEKTAIKIMPNIKFVKKVLDSEFTRLKVWVGLHPIIHENVMAYLQNENLDDDGHKPRWIDFFGGNDKLYKHEGRLYDLFNDLTKIKNHHKDFIEWLDDNMMDDLLFATLFCWGENSKKITDYKSDKYLDKLNDLYFNLRKAGVIIDQSANNLLEKQFRNLAFDSLPNNIRLDLISEGDVEAQAREIGEQLVYLPSDMKIVIKDRDGEDSLVIPTRLAGKLYDLILQEIIEENRIKKTEFYNNLKIDDFDSKKPPLKKSVSRFSNKNVRILNHLILIMVDAIRSHHGLNVSKRRKYLLIYDILNSLNYLPLASVSKKDKKLGKKQEKHPRADVDKYSHMKTIVRDYNPQNSQEKKGE